jgi:hypothetical protein
MPLNYQKPKQLISVDQAKELNKNYNLKHTFNVATQDINEDANAVWFSINEIQNYIDYIKEEGALKGHIIDGIRFYFGVYSDTESVDKAGFTTIFLSPTRKLPNSTIVAKDCTDLELLNYGSMGNPPKLEYGK